MSEMTTYKWSFLKDVNAYRDAGLGAMGVWRQKLVEFGEERGGELLAETGLIASSLSYAGGLIGTDGSSFLEAFDDAHAAIEQAAQIQAACLVVVSGTRGLYTHRHAQRLLVHALRRLGDLAGEQNVQIALQPMRQPYAKPCTFVNSLDKLLDTLAECNHPQVGMAFDVFHLWQELDLCSRIPDMLPWIKTVQLSDGREPPCSEYDRCLLGQGDIPLTEIMGSLEQAGYQGFYDIQILSEEVWNSNYGAVLKQCQAEFDVLCMG